MENIDSQMENIEYRLCYTVWIIQYDLYSWADKPYICPVRQVYVSKISSGTDGLKTGFILDESLSRRLARKPDAKSTETLIFFFESLKLRNLKVDIEQM